VILEADVTAAALLCCSWPFLVGKPLGFLLAPESRQPFYEFLLRTRLSDEDRVIELRLWRPGSVPHDVIAMAEPEPKSLPGPVGLRWHLRDVTSLRRVEQALRAERQLLDSVIDSAEAIILLLDENGRVLRANRCLREATGFSREDVWPRPWHAVLMLPQDRAAGQRLLHDAFRQGVAHTGDLALPARGGPGRRVVWSARCLPEGTAGAMVVVGHDVTELHEAQAQALQAERLATIGRMAAAVAHESRNSLQRIQACLSLLALRVDHHPDARDLIERAQAAQDDLHRLFDDVLGFAAVPRPRFTACDLADVWRGAWADVVEVPGHEGAKLLEDPSETSTVVEADPFQLKRVFRNLIENSLAAVTGPLRLVVSCLPASLAERGAVEVRLRDNGPGFAPGKEARLFEPFFTTKAHGTGLGLAICRRLIDAHGGSIVATGNGPGAEIAITLPRRMS
jgi:PAS domain S-box-containing protein